MKLSKLVCIGDSLTEGYGVAENAGWSALLKEDLKIEIINQGISGDTTAGMLARFQNDVISEKPTHVIITGGTNDLAWNLSDELILSNYSAMLRHSNRAKIQVIIGIPTPVFYGEEEGSGLELYLGLEKLSKRVLEFRRKLMLFAEHKELPVIDFFKNMTPEYYLPDGVHPNEKGHLVMKTTAATVLNLIIRA